MFLWINIAYYPSYPFLSGALYKLQILIQRTHNHTMKIIQLSSETNQTSAPKFTVSDYCNGLRYINISTAVMKMPAFMAALKSGCLFHEVKQLGLWLVPGWVTGCLTFWTTHQKLLLFRFD